METMPQNSTSAYDHLIKILLVGETRSNKTALLGTYLEQSEHEGKSTTTLGLDYKLKDISYNGKVIKLQLWDTAGQERFRSVTASYYRGAHGALLCFRMERDPSFITLSYWLDEIRDHAPVHFKVVLVAIETDSEDGGCNLETIKQFAQEKKIQLVTCSVSDKVKVQQVFQTLVEKIMGSFEPNNMTDSVHLHNDSGASRESQCTC